MTHYRSRFSAGVALAVLGLALSPLLESPKARALATLLLVASAVLLGLTSCRLHKTRHERSFLKNALLVYAPYAAVALLLAAALRVSLILAPPGETALATLSATALSEKLESDFARLTALNARLPERLSAFHAAASSGGVPQREWLELLDLHRDYGRLVETYKGFHRIDYVSSPALHAGALVIGLWACLRQQAISQNVSAFVEARPECRSRLDGYYSGYGKGNASAMIRSMGSDTTQLRIHAGAAYLTLVAKDVPAAFGEALPAFRTELTAAQRSSGPDTLRSVTDPLRRLQELDLP